MCTLVIAVDPGSEWTALVAATRDEFRSRPWQEPGKWWPDDYPGIVGGLDLLGGGTWLALDPGRGRLATVLNRTEPTDLSDAQARTRGRLPLLAVAGGADALGSADLRLVRPFNLVLCEPGEATWWRYDGDRLSCSAIPPGLHMIASTDLDDPVHPRLSRWLPEFEARPIPAPRPADRAPAGWGDWPELLADTETPAGEPHALNVRVLPGRSDYGTVSASLLALGGAAPKFEFSAGPPDSGKWNSIV